MSTLTKAEILRIFKALHRACQKTFKDDVENLTAMKAGINEHFQNNKIETDPEKIKKLYEDAVTIENEIRTKIVQVVEVEPGRHRMMIEPEHCVLDPTAFKKKRFKVEKKSSKS